MTVTVGHWFGGGPCVTVICTVTGTGTPPEHPLLSEAVKFTLKVWFAWPATGVKLNVPVAVGVPVAGFGLKLEFVGKLVACKVTVLPSGSFAETEKVSVWPTCTLRVVPPDTDTVGQLLAGPAVKSTPLVADATMTSALSDI